MGDFVGILPPFSTDYYLSNMSLAVRKFLYEGFFLSIGKRVHDISVGCLTISTVIDEIT